MGLNQVEVATVDPVASVMAVEIDALKDVAKEVKNKRMKAMAGLLYVLCQKFWQREIKFGTAFGGVGNGNFAFMQVYCMFYNGKA